VEADFVPSAPLVDVANVLTINPNVINVKNLKEFVDEVKAHPGKYNYASTGNGAGTHMAFAEFNSRLGLDMVHVPYKGGPEAITSVLRGETCCIMNQVQTVLSHYKAGKVRLLGVTTAKPVEAVKEVPTIAERPARHQGLQQPDLVRHLRAQGHGPGDHQEAQPGGQRRAQAARGARALCLPGQHHPRRDTRAVQEDRMKIASNGPRWSRMPR
jgi:hypothetical protein